MSSDSRPDFYHSETFALRSILPPLYSVGPRTFADLPAVGTVQSTAPVGLLEAITAAAGEALNQVGGLRLTRLTRPVSAGDTTFHVERSYGLPDAGIVAIDGIPYHYATLSKGVLDGVTYTHGGVAVPGAAADHDIGSQVTDLCGVYSSIDQASRALFVDTAEGPDLSVIGRNLGVPRIPGLEDDAQYRALIKTLAYNPRGTLLGLRLVLDALVGAGNYSIAEDPVHAPCKVFITVPGALFLNSVSQGKAYLQSPAPVTADQGKLTTSDKALFISSVRLPQANFYMDTHAVLPDVARVAVKPGAALGSVWAWSGTTDAPQGVSIQADVAGGRSTASVFHGAPGGYRFKQSIAPDSFVRAYGRFAFAQDPNASNVEGRQFGMAICDGSREVAWGVVNESEQPVYLVGLMDASTGRFLDADADPVALPENSFHDIELRKLGQKTMLLYIDGAVVQSLPYTKAAQTTAVGCDVGATHGQTTNHVQAVALGVAHRNGAEYLNLRNSSANPASLSTGAAGQLTLGSAASAAFKAADTGKTVRITQSAVKNAQGGNNNGVYTAAFVDARHLTLSLPSGTVQLSSAAPARIVFASRRLLAYPDSLGTKIALGPSTQGNEGTYTITKLLDPVSLTDLGAVPLTKPIYTNVCEVQNASFVTEAAVPFVLLPQFTAEPSVHFELVDAAMHTGNANGALSVTPRTPLPLLQGTYEVRAGNVLTGQVFDTHIPFVTIDANRVASAYPFYVSDAFTFVEAYLRGVVAAGVRLVFNFS